MIVQRFVCDGIEWRTTTARTPEEAEDNARQAMCAPRAIGTLRLHQ